MIGETRGVMSERLAAKNLPKYLSCFRGLVDPSFF